MIAIYAFNAGTTLKWPPDGLTTKWFGEAIDDRAPGTPSSDLDQGRAGRDRDRTGARNPRLASRCRRHRFFGRETISFLVILPIALPGIVTGLALSNTFTQVFGVSLGLFTVVVGHATFCIVVVYNNVIARLRRVSANLEEASADLGAHTWQTFRHVTLPNHADRAGGRRAARLRPLLRRDHRHHLHDRAPAIRPLPIWIFSNLFRGQQLPIANVVAVIVVLISIIPVYLAHRLTREESIAGRSAAGTAEAAAVVN